MTTSGRILIRRRPLSYSSRALNGAGPKGHDRRPGRACHSIYATQRGRGDGAASTGEAWDALHALWVRAAGRAGECCVRVRSSLVISSQSGFKWARPRRQTGQRRSGAMPTRGWGQGSRAAVPPHRPAGQQSHAPRTRHARGQLGFKMKCRDPGWWASAFVDSLAPPVRRRKRTTNGRRTTLAVAEAGRGQGRGCWLVRAQEVTAVHFRCSLAMMRSRREALVRRTQEGPF